MSLLSSISSLGLFHPKSLIILLLSSMFLNEKSEFFYLKFRFPLGASNAKLTISWFSFVTSWTQQFNVLVRVLVSESLVLIFFFCCCFFILGFFFESVWLEAYYGNFPTIFYWSNTIKFVELLLDFFFIEPKITDQDVFYLLRDLFLIFFFPHFNSINRNTL